LHRPSYCWPQTTAALLPPNNIKALLSIFAVNKPNAAEGKLNAVNGGGSMQKGDIVAAAMSAAWDRIKLHEKQIALAKQELAAFQTLAAQLGVPVDELRRRAELRFKTS
jgi:hypothetical protein